MNANGELLKCLLRRPAWGLRFEALGGITRMSKEHPRSKSPRQVILGISASVVLYVLSFGPAYSFGMRGWIPADCLLTVYRPLPSRLQVCLLEFWELFDPKAGLALNGER